MLKPLLECAATYLHVSLLFCVPQPGKHRMNGQQELTVRLRFFQLEVYSGESKGTTRPLPNPAACFETAALLTEPSKTSVQKSQ